MVGLAGFPRRPTPSRTAPRISPVRSRYRSPGRLVCDSARVGRVAEGPGLLAKSDCRPDYYDISEAGSDLCGLDAAEATSAINETLAGIAGRGDEVGLDKYPY